MLLADRRAAAAIEFAIALPFMMLLLVGAFDYGNLAYTMMEVNQAAHAGAFYAYQAYQSGGSCIATAPSGTPSIANVETSSTSLGSSVATSTAATGASALAKIAPYCGYSACYTSTGITQSSGTCSGGDPAGTYAVAYAQLTYKPLLPWTSLAFPSTISSLAVIRYK